MRYVEYKNSIQQYLRQHRRGATWIELREALALPYERPCPEWTRKLEQEIGLVRQVKQDSGRSLVWSLSATVPHPRPSRAHV